MKILNKSIFLTTAKILKLLKKNLQKYLNQILMFYLNQTLNTKLKLT